MMATTKREQHWLRTLARGVRARLAFVLPHDAARLRDSSALIPIETNTDGWSVTIGNIRGDTKSYFDVWLDRYASASGRRVSFAVVWKNTDYIEMVARNLQGESGERFHRITKRHLERATDGALRVSQPLAGRLIGKRVAELYDEREWNCMTLYHAESPKFLRAPSPRLINDGAAFFLEVVRVLAGKTTPDDEFPRFPKDLKARAKVRQHISRERSTAAALFAKIRDKYTCQVCGFYFAHLYGELGLRFAEAHHTVPLAKLRPGARIRSADLVTVCANCHRMLHRMKGGGQKDVDTLAKNIATSRRRRPRLLNH